MHMHTQISVQGLINLADNRPEDGGFQIVPGFHKNFLQWTNKTRSTLGKCFSDRQVRTLRIQYREVVRYGVYDGVGIFLFLFQLACPSIACYKMLLYQQQVIVGRA